MHWFLFALAAPALWAMCNHIDKYIISRYFTGRGVGSLVLFTALTGFVIAMGIAVFDFSALAIGVFPALIIEINGALLVASFIPYLHALESEEASNVIALYQLIPVFSYFLAILFLHEYLTLPQVGASVMVIAGAVLMSLDFSHTVRFKAKPFWLMVLAAFALAVNGLIFKMVALGGNFWGTAFWEYMGGAFFGLLLFTLNALYRRQFLATIQRGRSLLLGLNAFSELLNIAAKLLVNFASLLAPLALVWVVNGFQPLLAFLYGVLLTLFAPAWGRENLEKKVLIQKMGAIAIIFIGVVLLFTKAH